MILARSDGEVRRDENGGNWTTSKLNEGFLLYRETEPLPEEFSSPQFPIETVPLFTAGSLKANTQLIPDGMAKRTISLTGSDGNRYRVISYFYPTDVESHYDNNRNEGQLQKRKSFLKTPTEIPEFAVFGRHIPQSQDHEREYSIGEDDITVLPISMTTVVTKQVSKIVIPQQHNEPIRLQSKSACLCGGIERLANALRYDLSDCETRFRYPVYLASIKIVEREEDNRLRK
ncbi:hypothetical protein HK100_005597 [Physocladia obscura]|uniref:Uncharacterized protein n=1 Tax=Physocladia obscura TaxID=109957 RepID=A0AAD5T8E3_9FUNG|nr:hypothetical protein HK100_005597 [Physocladia obscura]